MACMDVNGRLRQCKKDFSETTTCEDNINPAHYKSHPSGIECIQISEHMNLCRGRAVEYIWRAGLKEDEIEDLEKAVWYLQREIGRLKITKNTD